MKMKELMMAPNCSAKHIADLVSQDQALASKVLKLANSPYFGVIRTISSIQQGVAFLGFNTLHNLVLASSLFGMYEKELKGYKMAKGALWEHSIYSAFAAQSLAESVGNKAVRETAFTAGLIHDVGKLVMSLYISEVFQSIMDLVERDGLQFLEAEKKLLGFDHAEIGSEVARKWRFPPALVNAIRYHHAPQLASSDADLVSIVHLSDAACLMMGKGSGVDGGYYPIDGLALQTLKMKEDDLQKLILRLTSSVNPAILEV